MAANELDRGRERFTDGGIPLKAVYGPEDLAGFDYSGMLGQPGEYPFTRGIYPTMYRKTPWAILNMSGYGGGQDTHGRQEMLLKEGQKFYFGAPTIDIVFDLPTCRGLDSDHPMAKGEFGRCGVGIDSILDLEALVGDFRLDELHTGLIAMGVAPVILAMYVAIADKQGVPRSKLGGTINNDPLASFISDNFVVLPPRPSLKVMIEVMRFCTAELPNFNPLTIQMYNIQERGATAAHELGYGFAVLRAICEEAVAAGLNFDDFAPNVVFFQTLERDFFEEIAKVRATRRMWARMAREEFGAQNPKSCRARIHTLNSGASLTAQEPLNNIARIAIEILSGALSGVNSMSSNAYDEALCIPTEDAVRTSLRIQQIVQEEIGITSVADPLGGSYFVEYLTNQIEERAQEVMAKIEEVGGAVEAIESGWIQAEQDREYLKLHARIESGERTVVGVNKYASETSPSAKIFRVPANAEKEARDRLVELRRTRDQKRVARALDELRDVVSSEGQFMPAMIEAVKSFATVGEVMDILREEYGDYWAGSMADHAESGCR